MLTMTCVLISRGHIRPQVLFTAWTNKCAFSSKPVLQNAAQEDEIKKTLNVAVPALLRQKTLLIPALSGSFSSTKATVDCLAALNGYRRIPLDDFHHHVQLAEGVMAKPSKTLEEYVIYGKPRRRNEEKVKGKKRRNDHPPFHEEDMRLYQIVQSRVEENLNRREERIRERVNQKVEQAHRSYRKVAKSMYAPIRRRKGASDNNDTIAEGEDKNDESTTLLPKISNRNQDLLILSEKDKKLLLVQDVPSEYSLLALSPSAYRLVHGRAASVIYAGIVVFGAAPLAYRSLKYAMDYPALAQVMVASVVGSVSYSLWNSRHAARTRQQLAVSMAAASRIVARDDAALTFLRNEATRALVDAIVEEYLARLNDGETAIVGEEQEHDASVQRWSNCPVDVAVELGLLVRNENGGLFAREWNEASMEIYNRFTGH